MKVTVDWPEPELSQDGDCVHCSWTIDRGLKLFSYSGEWDARAERVIPLEVRQRADEIWRKRNQTPEEKLKALIDELEEAANISGLKAGGCAYLVDRYR